MKKYNLKFKETEIKTSDKTENIKLLKQAIALTDKYEFTHTPIEIYSELIKREKIKIANEHIMKNNLYDIQINFNSCYLHIEYYNKDKLIKEYYYDNFNIEC